MSVQKLLLLLAGNEGEVPAAERTFGQHFPADGISCGYRAKVLEVWDGLTVQPSTPHLFFGKPETFEVRSILCPMQSAPAMDCLCSESRRFWV